MKAKIIYLILFVCSSFFAAAQGGRANNSIWRSLVTKDNVKSAKQGNHKTDYAVPDINGQTIHNGSVAKVYTFNYSFTGQGTEANPFLIATPEDLIAFSNAVNSKAKYGAGAEDYYYNAHFKLTADIDMSTRVEGPFVKCSEAIYASNPVSAYMRHQEHVLKATQSGGGYQCKAVIDDQGDENVSVTNTTSSTVRTYNRGQVTFGLDFIVGHVGKGQIKANVTDTFSYSFYSPTTLPQSALMDPIGSYARYIRNQGSGNETMGDFTELHTPFAGVFDGDNHTISNFEMVTSNNVTGLFGYLSGKDENHLAYVRNLRMNNCVFSGDNEYAGAIAGLIGWGKIENCYVTNSEINGKYAGGIVGGSTDGIKVKGGSVQLVPGVASDDIADGYIIGSTSEGNIIDGSEGAGGIIGYSPSPEEESRLVDNQVGDNQVAGESTGEIVPGLTGGDDDGIQGNGNIVHKHESDGLSFRDYIRALLAGMVPDFAI